MRSAYGYLALISTFLLGSHEGFIALWRTPGPEPDRIFPYSVASLPLADQKLLEKGIVIESEDALHHFLEDYLS